jgi:hypothetical protein
MPRLGLFIWATIYWGYRREVGEPQITFNYVRALADFINNFSFSRGVHFTSAKEYQHIIPALCKRIWEIDNEKTKLMWEMGQQGGVSGDVFVKIAYEPAWTTGIGPDGLPIEGVPQIPMAGRVKILPLNSAFCLTEDTEILTKRGWLHHADLTTLDEAASLNPETNEIVWTSVEQVNVFDWDGPLAKWENERFDVLSTPEHRWIYKDGRNKASIKLTSDLQNSRHNGGRLIVAGGESHLFAETATFTDDFVRLVGWFVTEGHWFNKGTAWQAPGFTQSASVYPQYADEIHSLLEPYEASRYVYEGKADVWYAASLRETMLDAVGLDKRFDINLLQKLTVDQAQILFETLIKGDGNVRKDANTTTFAQSDPGRVDDFQTLCMMLGKRTNVRWRQRSVGAPTADITMYSNDTVNVTNLERTEENYVGKVWCPTTGTGTWVARRNGISFYTGNCFPEWHPHDRDRLLRFKLKYRFWGTSPEGTRQVFTYTEILTDSRIEEYVNDELLDQRPNPLGMIPIVHIPNITVSGSPWGLSDVGDITALNREYNEKVTDISDIINYHAAPITIITGAKVNNLEKGPKKVWGGLPADANVFNLENAVDLQGPIAYLDIVKRAMHEMTGVPETALGQVQPISNTSGVALAVQYQPMMQRYNLKKLNYSIGFKRINEFALRTLFTFEPDAIMYDPDTEGIMVDGQPPQVDPFDPLIYEVGCEWPPPLPVDKLIKLQEIQTMFMMSLESKVGALKMLGEEFPDEKLQEIFEELIDDAKRQGALDLINAEIASSILALTGIPPEGQEAPPPQEAAAPGEPAPPPPPGPGPITGPAIDIASMNADIAQQTLTDTVQRAYGTKQIALRRPASSS